MPETERKGFRVALVGRRLEDNENLGLAYLRAALLEAGFTVELHVLNDGRDLGRVGAALLRHPPDLLGLSLTDGGSAFLPLGLGELLQAHGYRGHVTAGGPFATLARTWLLERYRWLGSVVRFAGEVPLPELARRLDRGLPADGVPGVTTRAGDGSPAAVLDPTPLRLRPARGELPRLLGHRAAHVAATRGCLGRCLYCGPAALQTLERVEGQRAGIPRDELDQGGVGGVRRRDLDDLCEEMAELWHERDVRYFYFVDEHLLPYGETDALEFLDRWGRGLARRKVGRFGIGGMLRADRVTPSMARAFAELGLVRVFLGLEFGTAGEARRFGRRAPGASELELLGTLARLGVVTVSNLMLVHPDSTPATIAAGIDFLERIPGGSFEATRMMAYHGTRLHERLAAEGRLLGNPLRYGYRLNDPVVERFGEIFSRLRGEAFRDYSIGYRTHDAHLAQALRGRLGERAPGETAEGLERVRREVNALYAAALRDGLALAKAGGGFAAADGLVGDVRRRAAELGARLERIEARLLADAPRGSRMFSPMRAAAAGAISFCLMGGTGACGGHGSGAGTHAAVEAREDGTQAPQPDTTSAADEPAIPPPPPPPCNGESPPVELERRIERIVRQTDPCFSGYVGMESDGTPSVRFVVEVYPRDGLGLQLCETGPATQAAERRLEQVLKSARLGCALEVGTNIAGGARQAVDQLEATVGRECHWGDGGYHGFTILLDGDGRVSDVRATDDDHYAASESLLRCIRDALDGLKFACLANMSVCSEWVIVE